MRSLLAVGTFAHFGPGSSGASARAMTIGFVGVGFVLMVLGIALRERGAVQAFLTQQRLDERLRAGRSSLADAIAVTVYLRSAADFATMNDEYRQAFRGTPPTRTTIVTGPLGAAGGEALVEISAP